MANPESADQRNFQSVTQLTASLKHQLESEFHSQWVSGEVSNLTRPSSGHLYFTLKDQHSQIRAVIWRSTVQRLRFTFEEGQQIICCGDVDLYIPRGSYQLICRQVEPVGEGALQIAFRQLHRKLEAEGLFDSALKKAVPRLPQRIALVTSPTGAAIRDFCQVVKRRWPGVAILLIPCRVQGREAAGEISRAIRVAQKIRPVMDAIVVTRGGGSIEDLWCFNDERVVRSIHRCRIPVISAVGHEIDVTLSDLAADLRALTPSEAGEKLVPDQREWRVALDDACVRMSTLLQHLSESALRRIGNLATVRVLRQPHDWLGEFQQSLDVNRQRLAAGVLRSFDRQNDRISALGRQLNSVSPLNTLARGYSVTFDSSGKVVRDSRTLQDGETISTRLHRGTVKSQVTSTDSDDD